MIYLLATENSMTNPPLPLNSNVDIWLTYYQAITDTHLLADMRSLLSDEERVQETRFHFADDRLRYLVTRALVRTVLSRYVSLPPEQWLFSANAWGRPQIANDAPASRLLQFNISHSRGLIALAVAEDRELGIDVENIAERPAPVDIASHFFAAEEARALAALVPEQQPARFFEYWTLKESYIKAKGMGLSLPLDSFSFSFPDEYRVRLEVDAEDDDGEWDFWQCRLGEEYILALCGARQTRRPVLNVREAVPLCGDSPIQLTWLKTSDSG